VIDPHSTSTSRILRSDVVLSFLGHPKAAAASPASPSAPAAKRAKPGDTAAAETITPELSIVLDALGGVLRTYGQHAFDTDRQTGDETRSLVKRWLMHVTAGAPSPVTDDERPAGGLLVRDWNAMQRFFSSARRDESTYVERTHKNLRESIWAFVGGLHQLVVEENEEGKVVQDHISRIRAAVAGQDTEQLKRDTLAAVSAMEKLTEARRERQRKQFSMLGEKLKELGRELEDARRENAVDGLTRLPNRKAFDDYITRCIELHSLMGRPACLLLIDIDNFKSINDTFGHPVGDDALRQVTRALSRTILRKMDFVCRLGGDEFAVILQETDGDGGRMLGEKLRRTLDEVLASRGENEPALECTISVGVAELELGQDALAWMSRADEALYEAKRAGRNQIAIRPTLAAPLPKAS